MAARPWVVSTFGAGLLLAGCVQTPPMALEPGVVLAASPTNQAGENTDAGAVAGVVLGAAAGGALGRGAGRVLGAALGGAVGGVAGSAAEGAAQPTDGAAYTVRLASGRVLTIVQHLPRGDVMLSAGQQIVVETRGRTQRVVAASAAS